MHVCFSPLVWLVGEGPSKCCGEVMHGKCSWNTTRSQRRQEQGGWWCSKRRQKGIAPGHFFLKAPSNLTHFVIFFHTHILCLWVIFFLYKIQSNDSPVQEKVNPYAPLLGSISMNEYTVNWFLHWSQKRQDFNINTCVFFNITFTGWRWRYFSILLWHSPTNQMHHSRLLG